MLKNQLHEQGNFFFRWRSFLPYILLPAALASMPYSGYLEAAFGEMVEEVWMVFCLAISLSGQGVRSLSVAYAPPGTSGRNTREQRAVVLNTSGMYSIVRHPLYVGNFIVLLGFALATKVWWFPVFASLAFFIFYERVILAEEAFLSKKFGQAYVDWAKRTPTFMLRPGLWRRPERPFSWRRVIRNEYNGFCLVFVVFPVIELVGDLLAEHQTALVWGADNTHWIGVFAAGVTGFLVFPWVKRHTSWLTVPA